MADPPAAPLPGVSEHGWELRKEASTMAALFVLACAVTIAVLKNLLAGH